MISYAVFCLKKKKATANTTTASNKKIGHLFQGRYKSILRQTDRYLGELVRYIHLNPVRAKMLKRPEDFEYSGHRAYLGLDKTGLVDTEPVLRHFGATKKRAD